MKSSIFSKASFTAGGGTYHYDGDFVELMYGKLDGEDIDIDDPDFWNKWAQKANVDVQAATSKTSLILDTPRNRRPGKSPPLCLCHKTYCDTISSTAQI